MSEMEFDFSSTPSGPGQKGMLARYNGVCRGCHRKIVADVDRITYVRDLNMYIHVDCVEDVELPPVSDPMPNGMCMICWQAKAANGTCGCQ